MEIYFKNSNMEDIYLLDSFKSLIWTDRYWKCGDLDISCDPLDAVLDVLTDTVYFSLAESPHTMVLETINIKSDIEDGDLLIIQGRSLESMLDRRIVWEPTALSGNLQTELVSVISENVTAPTNGFRDFPNWYSILSTDPLVTGLTVDTQFDGKYSVYKAVCEVCEANGLGFRVFYDPVLNRYNFELYAGVDRSFDQSTNTPVAFTSKLNNLLNANYVESSVREKNVCLVGGEEGVGNIRSYIEVGSGTGLARRETYIEPNINRNIPDGVMSDADYLLALEGKGNEELGKFKHIKAFDGEVDTTMYNFGDEFGMGDILQIADDYAHQTKSRVVEMVYSQDIEGTKMYPTFETVE